MEYSRKNMNWWPESFHPSANSDTNCIHSISFHSSNRVLLCLNWVGRWVRWWSVQKTERKQASYFVKLKLKLLQYSGHLTREPTRWERVRAGREVGGRGWDGWMASPTQRTWVWVNPRSWWCDMKAWWAAVHGVTKSGTRLSDWTELSRSLLNNWNKTSRTDS